MDIDSFFQNGDMSFGMDGRIMFADELDMLRADGAGRKEQVASWFPISDDCVQLDSAIQGAKKFVVDSDAKLANPKLKKGDKRVTQNYRDLANSHVGLLEAKQRELGCLTKKKQQEEAEFIKTLKDIAQPQGALAPSAFPTSNTPSNTDSGGENTSDKTKLSTQTLAIIIGGSVFTLLVIGIIFKKSKNQIQ